MSDSKNRESSSSQNLKRVKRFGRLETPSFWKPKGDVGTSDWMTVNFRSNWVWWVIGGYTVSVLIFRMSDLLNSAVVPVSWLLEEKGNVVNQIMAPEDNDLVALAIGAVAPCVSAPFWEVFRTLFPLHHITA